MVTNENVNEAILHAYEPHIREHVASMFDGVLARILEPKMSDADRAEWREWALNAPIETLVEVLTVADVPNDVE